MHQLDWKYSKESINSIECYDVEQQYFDILNGKVGKENKYKVIRLY